MDTEKAFTEADEKTFLSYIISHAETIVENEKVRIKSLSEKNAETLRALLKNRLLLQIIKRC